MCAAFPEKPAAVPFAGGRAAAAATGAVTSVTAANATAAARHGAGLLDDTRVVHPLTADEREDRLQPLQLLVGHFGVVGAEDDGVGKLPDLDRAEVVLHAHMPGVLARVEAHRLLPRDLLVDVDLLPERVQAGGRVVDAEPRRKRSDVDAVDVDAGLH